MYMMLMFFCVAFSVVLIFGWELPASWLRPVLWCPPFVMSTIIAVIVCIAAGPIAGAMTEVLLYPVLKLRWHFAKRT